MEQTVFLPDSLVKWFSGDRVSYGTVVEHYSGPVKLKINGRWIVKEATIDEPVYLVIKRDGRKFLVDFEDISEAYPAYERLKNYSK